MDMISEVEIEAEDFISTNFKQEISPANKAQLQRTFLAGAYVGFQIGQSRSQMENLIHFRDQLKKYLKPEVIARLEL